MSCRIIISPITKQEVTSKTWNDIRSLVSTDKEADALYDQLTSPEFIQWFGDWVNDPQNASKVVNEHGEPLLVYHGSQNEFDTFRNTFTGYKYNDRGFYFSRREDIAKAIYGPNVYPVFLNSRNPIETTRINEFPEGNYDGMIQYKNSYGDYRVGNEIVVFEPTQIKSVFNQGQFSESNPNIYLQQSPDAALKTNEKIKGEIIRFEKGELPKNHVFELGEPSPFLHAAGVADYPILLTAETLEATVQKQDREFSVSSLRNLVKGINFPIAVFRDEEKNPGKLSILTELKEGSTHILVALKLAVSWENGVRKYKVNEIISAYPKDNVNGILFDFQEGRMTFVHPDRALNWVNRQWSNSSIRLNPNLKQDKITKNIEEFQGTIDKNFIKYQEQQLNGTPDTVPSKASEATLMKVREFARKAGIDIKRLEEVLQGRSLSGINGVADALRGLVGIAEGKEAEALPEEVLHIAVAIIKQTHPTLYKQMLSRIGHYSIYRDVLQQYKNNPAYQKNGKPDIQKIKEEAMAKVLANELVLQQEGTLEKPQQLEVKSWWDGIVSWIKNLLKKAGFNPFQEALATLDTLPEGAARPLSGGVYFQLTDESKDKQKKIAASFQEKRDKFSIQKIEGTTQPTSDDEEVNGYKRTVNGVTDWVKKRVTDFVKDTKNAQVQAKFEQAPAKKKKEWKQKAEYGTRFHATAENIIKAALDKDGYLKPHDQVKLDDVESELPEELAVGLVEYLLGTDKVPGVLYTQFPQGTLFKVEEIVYDEKRDVAGTIDLLGITPQGKIIIWDWKTKFLNKQYYDDVPFFSQKDYRIQLGQYKAMMRTYGVPAEDVVVAQAQPIVMEGSVDKDGSVELTGMELPNLDPKKESQKYLVAVPVQDQKTGNEPLDKFIQSLYKLYENVYRTPSQDKQLKIQQLNSIASAIRELQIKQNFEPVAFEAQTFMLSAAAAVKDYRNLFFKDGKLIDPGFENIAGDKEAFDTLLSRMTMVLENMDQYAGLYGMFQNIYGGQELSEEQQKVQEMLKDVSGEASYNKSEVQEAFRGMMGWFAKKYGVNHILQNEKTVSGAFDRNVQSTSRIQTYAVELFYKLESEAKSRRDVAIQEELSSFQKVLDAFKRYAANKGLAARNFYTLITGDRNKNELLPKLRKEVYEELDKATDPSGKVDRAWIEKNVDMAKVRKEAKEAIQVRFDAIDRDTYSRDEEEDNRIKDDKKQEYAALWDFSDKGMGWYRKDVLRRNIREELWYTDEYKELMKQPEALAMYQWIEQFNLKALKSGYHTDTFNSNRRFLPWIKGTFLDKLGAQGVAAFANNIKAMWTLHEEEKQTYGKGEDLAIPRFFTQDHREDKESLSELSTDIGANMALYIQSVLDYQAMSEIEDYADAILTLEKNKDHLVVGRDGNIVMDNGQMKTEKGNEENARLLESQIEMLVYKRLYNKASGLPEEANKAIEHLNNFLRLKVFSLNVIMPFVNTVGSNLQAMINANKLYRGSEWLKNEAMMVGDLFKGHEGNITKGLVDYFMPLLENENAHTGKQMSVQALKKWTVGDVLMGHIRKSDRVIQLATAMTLLENTMVAPNGELVNIREWYRNSPEYRERYKLPEADRKKLEGGFEAKVAELKEKNSLVKKAQFNKGGILEIEGVSRDSETFHRFRRVIQNEISNIVGQISEDEKRDMERNILLKSMMMFKSWIPNLAQVRFAQLQKNAKTNEYNMGRARIWWSILYEGADGSRNSIFGGLKQGLKDLHDMRVANERGIKLLQDYYTRVAQNYYNRTGKELEMTPEQFYDMTRQAILMQLKDNIALLSLVGMMIGYSKLPPPDDDDLFGKNTHKNISRILDKLTDEVSFYYNPLSAKTILGGGLMPSIGILSDAINTLATLNNDITGDEAKQEKTHSIKTVLKNFPIFFQGTQFFLPMIDPETARDLGIKVAANNNYR